MNIRNLLTKLFLGFYLVLLLPHILELSLSLISILILVSGILFAIIAHQSKYAVLATLLLILHMVLELPHMIEHAHHDGIGIIFVHGLHVIFDVVLLYTLSKSWKYFLVFILLVVILGFGMESFVPVMSSTKPFVLGGVLGCVGTHFLFMNTKKLAN
jgi:hypothetical protein